MQPLIRILLENMTLPETVKILSQAFYTRMKAEDFPMEAQHNFIRIMLIKAKLITFQLTGLTTN